MVPRIIWTFYIEAFIVATFRYEWTEKYREWNVWLDLHKRTNRIHPGLENLLALPTKTKSITSPEIPISHDHQNCSRIRLNVGGRLYETQLRTLNRFPQTLLGNPERRLPYYDPAKQYYYFDRSRDCFENVLYYYQSGGRLLCPMDTSSDIFLNEIEFFDLGSDVIRKFQLDEGLDQEDENANIKLPISLIQRKLWLLLEYPTSSAQAKIVSIISVYVILISVVVFCLETMPIFKEREGYWYQNNDDPTDDEYDSIGITDPLAIVESICVVWFTAELLLRFASCPDKLNAGAKLAGPMKAKEATSLAVIRVIRLVRVFRIFKLSRHVKGLKILGWTLKASFNELGLLIFFLAIGVVLFSSALFFAEEAEDSIFPSIPSAFFWAVTTMTTVGYGDAVPRGVWGKVIGSLCAITGVLTLALPVPVMVSNFNYFYNQEISRSRSINDGMETHHVEMCCFLPGNGIHPDADKKNVTQPKTKKHGTNVAFSKNPYVSESDGSFYDAQRVSWDHPRSF
ncbi:unnamed protein product [Allacma fusca]|uniref:BTB domain-containing protein n=1 Tax=Allacma fusca TaxID=39272 RepID=A0A8J2NXM3_9HEXA|nr:unnamed protein product [Allacma fusca]